MELLTLVVYLPIAAIALFFVYLTMGGFGLALVIVGVVFNLLNHAAQPKH